MFNKYYKDELSYLLELGREFYEANPDAAPFLAERGNDPDVERLLEGFAFLTGRIRQKLDDEFPELTHALLEILWPHYLRPIPAMTIVEFEALPQAQKESHHVPRGTEIDSIPLKEKGEVPCRFRTAYDVDVQPVLLKGAELRMAAPPELRLRLDLAEGLRLGKTPLPSLKLFLHGDSSITRELYLCLRHLLKGISVETASPGRSFELGPEALRPMGFDASEGLFPFPARSFEGFRLLLEYFSFPAKFLFLELTGLEKLAGFGEATSFEVVFRFHRLPQNMPALGTAGFKLNCTPAVNCFGHPGDPISIDPQRTEYRVRPSGADSAHHEVYSIVEATGSLQGGKAVPIRPLFRFRTVPGEEGLYYSTRIQDRSAREGEGAGEAEKAGTETFISFGGAPKLLEKLQVVSLDLLCTNRLLPLALQVGDVRVRTPSTPVNLVLRNISRISAPVPPPLGSEVYWRLISHLSLGYQSIYDLERLRAVLGLYNFRARVDRQAEQALNLVLAGIQNPRARPETRFFRGTPVRGISVDLDLDELNFGGEGAMFLFASVLERFLALYVSLNSFSQLTVKGLRYGEEYRWPPRIGQRIAL